MQIGNQAWRKENLFLSCFSKRSIFLLSRRFVNYASLSVSNLKGSSFKTGGFWMWVKLSINFSILVSDVLMLSFKIARRSYIVTISSLEGIACLNCAVISYLICCICLIPSSSYISISFFRI